MRRNDRRGFTLMELLLVVAILGIVAAIAFPRFSEAMRRSNLRNARATAANMYAAARNSAVESNRVARLRIVGNSLVVLRNSANGGGVLDTIVPLTDFGTRFGVVVSGTTDSLVVDPRGFSTAGTIRVVKDAAKDSITVNAYGRLSR